MTTVVEGSSSRKSPDTSKVARRGRMQDERVKAAHLRAEEMHAAWQKLSPSQQLESLDKRLGKGVGAVKQRARIAAKLQVTEAKKAIELNEAKVNGEAEVEKMNEKASKKTKKITKK